MRLPKNIRAVSPIFVVQDQGIMKPRPVRLCIYPKDIQRITGKSERYSRNLIHSIKTALGKAGHQILTVEELCTFIGLSFESVKELIKNYDPVVIETEANQLLQLPAPIPEIAICRGIEAIPPLPSDISNKLFILENQYSVLAEC